MTPRRLYVLEWKRLGSRFTTWAPVEAYRNRSHAYITMKHMRRSPLMFSRIFRVVKYGPVRP